MKKPVRILPLLCILPVLLLGGCTQPSVNYVKAYQEALQKQQGTVPDDATVKRFMDAYAHLPTTVNNGVLARLYAPRLYFCDTIKVLHTRKQVMDYLRDTIKRLSAIDVKFMGYSRSGQDVLLRWEMTTKIKMLGSKRTATTIGVTQLRFNKQGQVIFHQDFWDSGLGVYDQIPVIGSITRKIRSSL